MFLTHIKGAVYFRPRYRLSFQRVGLQGWYARLTYYTPINIKREDLIDQGLVPKGDRTPQDDHMMRSHDGRERAAERRGETKQQHHKNWTEWRGYSKTKQQRLLTLKCKTLMDC